MSPYEDVLNTIVKEIMRARELIWADDFGFQGDEDDDKGKEAHMERLIESFIALSENEILVSHKWNLNLGSGEEILSQLLKLSNQDYDFNPLHRRMCYYSLNYIFSGPYQLNPSK